MFYGDKEMFIYEFKTSPNFKIYFGDEEEEECDETEVEKEAES